MLISLFAMSGCSTVKKLNYGDKEKCYVETIIQAIDSLQKCQKIDDITNDDLEALKNDLEKTKVITLTPLKKRLKKDSGGLTASLLRVNHRLKRKPSG